ncbi:hypothetical protein [Rosistilla oblonga]|uniref:hypothetical protein n=1 Tax=Rosistilla oblonga TaxID=2527990 RepID=UPI003A974456
MDNQLSRTGDAGRYPTESSRRIMPRRRDLIAYATATLFGIPYCATVRADTATEEPLFLHIYSNTRGSTYDQDKKNRNEAPAFNSQWVRVVSLLVVPNTRIYVRLPGGRDPDITVDGNVARKSNGQLVASLNVAWDDSYITERHSIAGPLEIKKPHPSSTIHCRYIFSRSKDAYDALDHTLAKDGR